MIGICSWSFWGDYVRTHLQPDQPLGDRWYIFKNNADKKSGTTILVDTNQVLYVAKTTRNLSSHSNPNSRAICSGAELFHASQRAKLILSVLLMVKSRSCQSCKQQRSTAIKKRSHYRTDLFRAGFTNHLERPRPESNRRSLPWQGSMLTTTPRGLSSALYCTTSSLPTLAPTFIVYNNLQW